MTSKKDNAEKIQKNITSHYCIALRVIITHDENQLETVQ